MGFTSHQQMHGEPSDRNMLGAPTSFASIMVIGPHHAAVTHVGDSSEAGQWEHMVRQWAIKVSGEIIPGYRKSQRDAKAVWHRAALRL